MFFWQAAFIFGKLKSLHFNVDLFFSLLVPSFCFIFLFLLISVFIINICVLFHLCCFCVFSHTGNMFSTFHIHKDNSILYIYIIYMYVYIFFFFKYPYFSSLWQKCIKSTQLLNSFLKLHKNILIIRRYIFSSPVQKFETLLRNLTFLGLQLLIFSFSSQCPTSSLLDPEILRLQRLKQRKATYSYIWETGTRLVINKRKTSINPDVSFTGLISVLLSGFRIRWGLFSSSSHVFVFIIPPVIPSHHSLL